MTRILLSKGTWGLAAHRSRANKQPRLVERKVCFISDAGNLKGEQTSSEIKQTVCVRVCLYVFRGTGWARAKAAVLLLFRTSHWEGYVTARQGLC